MFKNFNFGHLLHFSTEVYLSLIKFSSTSVHQKYCILCTLNIKPFPMFQLEALTRQSRRSVAVISAFYYKCRVGLADFIEPPVFN